MSRGFDGEGGVIRFCFPYHFSFCLCPFFVFFLFCFFWFSICFAIVIGLIWGLVPLTGSLGVVGGFMLNLVCTFLFWSKFLRIDDDEMLSDVLKEGLGASLSAFLVSILVFMP